MERKRIILVAVFLALMIVGLSRAAAGVPPTFPFLTDSYGGVTMTSATPNGTNQVDLVGYVSNPATDPDGWFIIGPDSGSYSYYSVMMSANASGYFTDTIFGVPLIPGETYYVRAVTENGRSSTEKSFSLSAADPLPTTTFGVYWDNIQQSNKSPANMMGSIPLPLIDLFAGHEGSPPEDLEDREFGWGLLWVSIQGITFVAFWLRQNDLTISMSVFMCAGTILIPLLPVGFRAISFSINVAIAAGVLYYFFKRDT